MLRKLSRRCSGLMVTAQAALRMKPAMFLFRLRRVLRNQMAPHFGGAYASLIASRINRVPLMDGVQTDTAMVEAVAAAYVAKGSHSLDGIDKGRVTLFQRTVDFGAPDKIDWRWSDPEEGDHQLWQITLNYMEVGCPLLRDGGADAHETVVAMIRGFRAQADLAAPGIFTSCWFPYAVSQRMLSLISGLQLARQKGTIAPHVDAEITQFLRENAAFLLDNVEHDLRNNHVERNLMALCLYFHHVRSVPDDIARKIDRWVRACLDATVLADGVQIERSAMYQGMTVLALRCFTVANFLSPATRDIAGKALVAAERALVALTHPDGEIALFNDAWRQETPITAAITAEMPRPGLTMLSAGGYARLDDGGSVCILDGGAIGPGWNPGHGHADFLSVEVSLQGKRVVVDPGTSQYNSGARRQWERGASAHNGPCIDGWSPVVFRGCFRVGRMVQATLVPVTLDGLPAGCSAAAAVLAADGHRVARLAVLVPGKGFLIADRWAGQEPKAKVTWLLPGEAAPVRQKSGAGFGVSGSDVLRLVVGAVKQWEPAQHAYVYGHLLDATALTCRPEQGPKGALLVTWIGLKDFQAEALLAPVQAMVETL